MIANLKASLGLDSKPYQTGVKGAEKANDKFKSNLKSVAGMMGAAFSVGMIINAGKALVRWASEVSLAAQNMGIATSEMMALNEAAARGGLEVGDLQKMLARLQTELFRAATGEQTSADKFEQMGLKIKDLIALNPSEMLQEVTRAAFESALPVATLAELFGEKLGPRAIDALTSIAKDGLPEVDEAIARTADRIKAMGDEWAGFGEKAKRTVLGIAATAHESMGSLGTFVGAFIGQKGGIGARVQAGKGALTNEVAMEMEGERAEEQERINKQKEAAAALVKIAEDTERKKQAVRDKAAAKELENQKAKDKALQIAADAAALEAASRAKEKAQAPYLAAVAGGQANVARLQEQLTSIAANTRGSTIDRGALAAIGGHSGGERGGYERESKSYRVAVESKQILEDIKLVVSQIELAQTLGGV